MPFYHAVVFINHEAARIVQFDADHVLVQKVAQHVHVTRQHNSGVRTEHEFLAEVCDALEGIKEILMTGSKMPQADFRRYVTKHRPALVKQIVGWRTTDHVTEDQLLELAREFFAEHARLAPSL